LVWTIIFATVGDSLDRFHFPNALLKPLFVVEPFASGQTIVLARDRDHLPDTFGLKTRVISPS
jgi:hypothetical protein